MECSIYFQYNVNISICYISLVFGCGVVAKIFGGTITPLNIKRFRFAIFTLCGEDKDYIYEMNRK